MQKSNVVNALLSRYELGVIRSAMRISPEQFQQLSAPRESAANAAKLSAPLMDHHPALVAARDFAILPHCVTMNAR